MFKKKEVGVLVLVSLIIGFVISFKKLNTYEIETLYIYLKNVGYAFTIVFLSMIIAKLTAHRYGCDAEFRLWDMHRYGFHHAHYSKKPIPTWLIFPIGLIFLSLGVIKWLALCVFDIEHISREVKGKPYAKITEWELALIAFYSLLSSIALAIFSQAMGWNELAALSIWFAFFSVIPFSELNGMKIIQGSVMLWIFSAISVSSMIILINMLNPITTLISGIIFGVAMVIAWFHFFERQR